MQWRLHLDQYCTTDLGVLRRIQYSMGILDEEGVTALKKYDKTMAKSIDCECQLEPSLLFEFSLTCTILEKASATTFSVLNNWYVNV